MPNADAIPLLEPPPTYHRRLVEQHVHSLLDRHSCDLNARPSDGGALSLDDLTVVHGLDRYSMPSLVQLGPSEPSWAVGGGSSRVSSAGLAATSSSLGGSGFSSPDHELANTRAHFVGVTRARAGGHCEFLVQVDTGKEQFVVRKRYSEFRDLRLQLMAALKAGQHCRGGACASLAELQHVKFPRRKVRLGLTRSASAGHAAGGDLDTARGRVVLLQRFIEALLRVYRSAPKRQVRCCLNAQCKMLGDVRAFLDLRMPEGGALSLGDSAGPSPAATLASSASARDMEWRERAKSTGSSVTIVSPSSTVGDCFRASIGLARGRKEDTATDSKDAAGSRRSQAAASARASLYTITEDLESLHLHAK